MAVAAELQNPLRFSDAAALLKSRQVEELEAVNGIILDHLASSVPLIPEVAAHLISAGGKRLRPLMTLAAASLVSGVTKSAQFLAGAVELIHAATLLHDDVVDDSDLRRGLKTANVVFGNKESVLVGDFLFARAFELMVKTGSLRVLDILSRASCTISEGEVLQLETQSQTSTDRETYIRVVSAKTAALFSAATEAGAIVASGTDDQEAALRTYGLNFGIAYQLVDDALDYSGTADQIGKSAGDDFREGKMTLPVILAIQDAKSPDEQRFWERTISQRIQEPGDFERACGLIAQAHGSDRTLDEAQQFAANAADALTIFPAGDMRTVLQDLALSSAVRRA